MTAQISLNVTQYPPNDAEQMILDAEYFCVLLTITKMISQTSHELFPSYKIVFHFFLSPKCKIMMCAASKEVPLKMSSQS